ncbi:MAG: hypothetical protein A2W09_05640 [Deltaproteobacteria bacterium RBG_16_50_11]|nr:MAG: hypothetical protein A2W09_05640 [Deltaproteobacteria bacterium RBG_16_50_11]
MEFRKLGVADIDVSAIALGCWSIGGGYTWGDQDEKESLDTIKAAIDLGINLFDTAEKYNEGYSEKVLGKGLEGNRSKVLISTKVWPENLTKERLIKAFEDSLKRLNTDYIDLYQIHWSNKEVPVEETLNTMEKLKKDGKVRFTGVSNFGVQDLTGAVKAGKIVTNQLPYSLLFRAIEHEILEKCREFQVGILPYSPLAQGLLTGKFKNPEDVDDERARLRFYSKNRKNTVHDEGGYEKEVFEALAQIRLICEEIGEPMANVAIAWVLHQPGIRAVLVGARKPEQIIENTQAVNLKLTDSVLKRLSHVTEKLKTEMGPNADPWRTKSRIK